MAAREVVFSFLNQLGQARLELGGALGVLDRLDDLGVQRGQLLVCGRRRRTGRHTGRRGLSLGVPLLRELRHPTRGDAVFGALKKLVNVPTLGAVRLELEEAGQILRHLTERPDVFPPGVEQEQCPAVEAVCPIAFDRQRPLVAGERSPGIPTEKAGIGAKLLHLQSRLERRAEALLGGGEIALLSQLTRRRGLAIHRVRPGRATGAVLDRGDCAAPLALLQIERSRRFGLLDRLSQVLRRVGVPTVGVVELADRRSHLEGLLAFLEIRGGIELLQYLIRARGRIAGSDLRMTGWKTRFARLRAGRRVDFRMTWRKLAGRVAAGGRRGRIVYPGMPRGQLPRLGARGRRRRRRTVQLGMPRRQLRGCDYSGRAEASPSGNRNRRDLHRRSSPHGGHLHSVELSFTTSCCCTFRSSSLTVWPSTGWLALGLSSHKGSSANRRW